MSLERLSRPMLSPGWTTLAIVNAAVGARLTIVIWCSMKFDRPPESLTVRRTVYVPLVEYECAGDVSVLVVPSPKFHDELKLSLSVDWFVNWTFVSVKADVGDMANAAVGAVLPVPPPPPPPPGSQSAQ